ncbi:cysteine peptidase family C39 domain-containing protein [Vibrio sp. AK197]
MRSIPYVSQHWRKCCTVEELQGYSDDFIDEWSHKSCGLACVKMIIDYLTNANVSLIDIYNEAINAGFYTPKGWIHSGLVSILRNRNIISSAKPANHNDILLGLSEGNIYITSVTHKFPTDGRKGGHLILAYYSDNNFIYFNDPSTWGEKEVKIDIDVFFSSYSGRCIEVKKYVF